MHYARKSTKFSPEMHVTLKLASKYKKLNKLVLTIIDWSAESLSAISLISLLAFRLALSAALSYK